MAYSELIKNIEGIRDYMREFYVFGFKSRDEYDAKSARSYDNEKRRIESWLGEYMSFYQDVSRKSVFLSVDSRNIPHNPFYKAFKAKSFTAKDITLHFYILDILGNISALIFPFVSSLGYAGWNQNHPDAQFAVWNYHRDRKFCSCLSGGYRNAFGRTRFYFRCPGTEAALGICRQLVYTAENVLRDGFGTGCKKIL